MLNRVMLIGNLGKDPELRSTEGGTLRANFSIATNENYKDKNGNWQKSTEWHDIVLWRTQAEKAKNLRKGMLVYLEGKLTHRKWQDKEGKDHYVSEVVVDMLKILEKREHGSPSGNVPQNFQDHKENSSQSNEFTSNVEEDDLPF
ncbi:MAG: single-stranded DNA-binding protein [Saprospiraceae bacterium]|nr:single-stranded DNA-binding protein [Saprospiraceae bacterium]